MSKYLNNLRTQQQSTKEKVEAIIQESTGLSDFEYRMFIYESGIAFLEIMEGKEGEYFKILESKRSFWNWWTTKWYSRDVAFLRSELPKYKAYKPTYVEPAYKAWHDLTLLRKKTTIEGSYYHFVQLQEL
jgi:hypothetical protein